MTVDRRANASKYYDCVVHIVMHNLQHIQIKHIKKELETSMQYNHYSS